MRITTMFLIATNVITLGIVIFNQTNENRLDSVINHQMLTVAEKSYFIGCGSVSGDLEYCKILAEQYRLDMHKTFGGFGNYEK